MSQATPTQSSIHETTVNGSSDHSQPTTSTGSKVCIVGELDGNTTYCTAAATDIYRSYQSPEIQTFVEDCGLYKNKQWAMVMKAATPGFLEKDLYEPFRKIFGAILEHFHRDDSRSVVDTDNTTLVHGEDGTGYFRVHSDGSTTRIRVKTSPALSILGSGPYFAAESNASPRYHHCVAPVEIKRDGDLKMHRVMVQLGEYARQCFIQQPNRRYVPSIVITESKLILFVYDRSGSLNSQDIDFHSDPESFVRIIIGVSSVEDDLRYSPFDPRITWENDFQFDSEAPILPLIKVKGDTVEYKVTEKFFQRRTIVGRGTICWRTETEIEGQVVRVLIKDSWRFADRTGEWEFMDRIQGLAGVGQILSYDEDHDCRISHFRDFIFKDLYKEDAYEGDRIFSRLVLKAYGRSIRYFKTKIQLLEAFRDAVAGHRHLWLKGILHRDVSVDNILLGEEGAPEGYRGILIDFDMAISVDRNRDKVSRFRSGTRVFQSVAVLLAGYWDNLAPPQDHLDDLESYFYVFAWMCHKYDGTTVSLSPAYLDKWEVSDPDDCASAKMSFLRTPTLYLPLYFQTTIFKILLKDLGKLCDGWVSQKAENVVVSKPVSELKAIHKADTSNDAVYHNKFLAIIDTALEAQRRELVGKTANQHNEDAPQAPQPICFSPKRTATDAFPEATRSGPPKRLKITRSEQALRRSDRLVNRKPR